MMEKNLLNGWFFIILSRTPSPGTGNPQQTEEKIGNLTGEFSIKE
jgi:hypothetical protein